MTLKCKICGSTDIKFSKLSCKPFLCMGCGLRRDKEIEKIRDES